MISPVVPGERAQLPTASPNAEDPPEDTPEDAPEDAVETTTATPTSDAVAVAVEMEVGLAVDVAATLGVSPDEDVSALSETEQEGVKAAAAEVARDLVAALTENLDSSSRPTVTCLYRAADQTRTDLLTLTAFCGADYKAASIGGGRRLQSTGGVIAEVEVETTEAAHADAIVADASA